LVIRPSTLGVIGLCARINSQHRGHQFPDRTLAVGQHRVAVATGVHKSLVASVYTVLSGAMGVPSASSTETTREPTSA
jgi:hypothetical protein